MYIWVGMEVGYSAVIGEKYPKRRVKMRKFNKIRNVIEINILDVEFDYKYYEQQSNSWYLMKRVKLPRRKTFKFRKRSRRKKKFKL